MNFYMHAGSLNHGCEAIVRSTVGMIGKKIELYSEHPDEDLLVGLNKICYVRHQGHSRNKKQIGFIISKVFEMLFHSDAKFKYLYKNILKNAHPGDVFVSIGGDNYCYGNNPNLFFLNKTLTSKGAKTVLWGCSIEPQILGNQALIADLNRYTWISARESITYEALIRAGVKEEKVFLYPDPAFTLTQKECTLNSELFTRSGTVGINISPLVNALDSTGKIVYENYKILVDYILKSTDYSIALIPHVCKPGNDDRTILRDLKNEFPNSDRVIMVNEEGSQNCEELKYIISNCRFMITARTHASIAAYSTCVPTLVIGYSVKAKGIAKDIFGSYEDYVVDIREMKKATEVKEKFIELTIRELELRDHLEKSMPIYIEKAKKAINLFEHI